MTLHDGTKIGCIGLGNMGLAIITGLSKQFSKEHIFGYDIDHEKSVAAAQHLIPCDSLEKIAEACSVLIFAVKPDTVLPVLSSIKDYLDQTIILSIAAGITIDAMETAIGTDKKIIRVMPNTPALVGEGMTVLSANNSIEQMDVNLAEDIFSLLGKVLVMPEKYLDAVTAVSGCGPAYGFSFIQAMTDGGVKLGIPRHQALLLAAQTLKGAADMILQSEEDPITLRGKVTSPGGSTIAAVHILERAGIQGIIMDAIEEAAIVSARLGEKK